MVVKISDFGESRHFYDTLSGYKRKSRDYALPYRWMALEILDGAPFTPHADTVCIIKCNSLSVIMQSLTILLFLQSRQFERKMRRFA